MLKDKGHLIIAENISKKEDKNYIKFRTKEQYLKLFKDFKLKNFTPFKWGDETHAILHFKG